MLAIAVMAALPSFAEQGDMGFGVQMDYASRKSMIGLGAQFQLEPVRNFRIAPEFLYYFETSNLTAYNVNFNLHYLIRVHSGMTVYPLAGFSYAHFNFKDVVVDSKANRYGANIGVGFEYRLTERLSFYTEQRFQILKNWNQSVTCLGLKVNF